MDLHLRAVYVDHGLRSEAARQEWAHVEQLATSLGVDASHRSVDAASYSTTHRLSLEHACRELRYQVLREEAAGQRIVLAHTRDDQAEQVLLRLLRGSGAKGLSGMRMEQGDLLRPLLDIPKAELLSYIEEKGVEHCVDGSNTDLRFLRNRVRHELLPFLEEHFDKGVRQALLKSADSLAADEALLEDLTEQAMRDTVQFADTATAKSALLHRQPFCHLHAALQRRVMERLLWQLGSRASYRHIMELLSAAQSGRTESELHLKAGLRVRVDKKRLEFSYPCGKGAWRGRLLQENGTGDLD
jgi:tRNA(Ile)-lysidine synthase